MHHRQMEGVTDMEKTFQWLEKDRLKHSTETLSMAAQKQVLSTRSIEVV